MTNDRTNTAVNDPLAIEAEVRPFELMVSEFVSNALVHGSGQIAVRLSRNDRSLRLEVSDDGGLTEPQIHPKAIGGWGLQFVDTLADGWGSDKRGSATVVWAVKGTSEP